VKSQTESLLTYLPPIGDGEPPEPEDLFEAFSYWAAESGRPLYDFQQEALLEALTGSHVIIATPTGSGKSMIALGAQFAALAAWRAGLGGRTFYTAPIKALVSEKFFDLVEVFGSENVGMMTGDTSVNSSAPIIACTAEVLANLVLRDPDADIAQVVMDEFHFYGDPQRGWAWQVPLLELPHTQFILMSATLGDTSRLRADLEERTGRQVAEIVSVERPVPLEFEYLIDPLTDVLPRLIKEGKAPVYIVHFTQKEAVERAQALTSVNLTTKAEKDAIAAELRNFKFGTGFGKTLSRLVRAGVGVHHAGMLPKYRRLIERLTARGLLKVVCGTDTLGVGINMPIRTVLFTSLVKYDGERSRHLTAREFHQIAGRAGRAGYDTMGEVLVMAPEHVIANRTALLKAGDDAKKQKKIVRKKAAPGTVNWTESTFERLRDASPEALASQFRVTHAMLLNLLARARAVSESDSAEIVAVDPVAAMRYLLETNHSTDAEKAEQVRQAFRVYRSLRTAEVVEPVRIIDYDAPAGYHPSIRLTHDIPEDFALNQTLSPFALAAFDLLDPQSPTHALDLLSVIEATLEDPRQVLYAQEKAARNAAIAEMKADGLEYHDRMERLLDVTWPRPLADQLETAFAMYVRTNPWVAGEELKPKSVVRDLLESADTFTEYVSRYGLERSEGVLLRYLTDAYRTLRQVVPLEHRTSEVAEITEWLGELVRGVDSSLLEEWEQLANRRDGRIDDVEDPTELEQPTLITANRASWCRWLRNAMFRLVELAAREDYPGLAARTDWPAEQWADALDPLFVAQGDDAIGVDASARAAGLLTVLTAGEDLPPGAVLPGAAAAGVVPPNATWLRQVLDDADGDHDWAITALADHAASDAAEAVVLKIVDVGPMTSLGG